MLKGKENFLWGEKESQSSYKQRFQKHADNLDS